MEKINLKNGVDLYYSKSDKFKTWSAGIYIYRPLNNKEASANALLAKVLQCATSEYPTRAEFSRRLETLYGALIFTGARKYADTHMLVINIKAVCDRFLPKKISADVLDFAKQVLLSPLVKNYAFDEKIVELEKENLKKQIEAYINEKTSYADKRCIEIMCEGDDYATDVNGTIEEIEKITPESLYRHYLNVLENSKIDIFLNGEADKDLAAEMFSELKSNGKIPETKRFAAEGPIKEVTDKMEVTQGKLVMGFTLPQCDNADRCRAMVFNAVFGGSAMSKLFNNVREKLSLAYYAGTVLYFSKGIMTARSGIEPEKYEQVKTEILNQLDDIVNGEITDEEMENAISHLVNIYSSLDDSPEATVSVLTGWIVEGESRTPQQIVEEIKKVTKEQVVDFAKGFKLNTVYFLTSN